MKRIIIALVLISLLFAYLHSRVHFYSALNAGVVVDFTPTLCIGVEWRGMPGFFTGCDL